MEKTITHHPDVATLMCCSAGSQPEACAAVIASHLAVCSQCRAEVRRMQKIGVALFDTLEPECLAAPPPIVSMRAAEADNPDKKEPCVISAGEIPQFLVSCVGPCLDKMSWDPVGRGVWTHAIALSPGACGDLRLLKVEPGAELPEHDHPGWELTLILRGSYTDELGTFRPGDVADLDAEVKHRPVACPKDGCICLMASEHKLSLFERVDHARSAGDR
ncbi:ChrR family anti-sigma-E factor [Hyphomicrobium sp. CS1GBMeth3]|uniref:ChrR family anti-sigma-E factor n=1 Tax=Hyphomicrobium sp. CS1GBMeth3 TaxID=1892845 RepID=UPI0009308557|nr:ChrR family anti-sigma-E factor [Hyphomicrobium sp. CS1GBMeth3]